MAAAYSTKLHAGTRLAVAFVLGVACQGQPVPSFPFSEECALCHSQIAPPARATWKEGPSIAPAALWPGSMMARAAQDPYWKAKVRYESSLAGEAIEATCLRCHAPAQQPATLKDLDPASEGVTCSVCHQLSRKGGFTFDAGRAYGPHRDPFTMPMQHHTDLVPTHSEHVLQSAFCATCHTVITHPEGTPEGTEFVEQSPFQEWLGSAWAKEGRSCQSCHMPVLKNETGGQEASYIAHNPMGRWFPPTLPRTPFGLHLFAGGNYQMLPQGARTLLTRAAALEVKASGGEVEVTIRNLAGHKLPTAYPSRRMWLHVRGFDAAGQVVFESGAYDERSGELTSTVHVYEAEAVDARGRPTLSLHRAAAYGKDTRIPPRGFDGKPGQHSSIYKTGSAAEVEVELLFQSIKPAHLEGLAGMPAFNRLPAVMARERVRMK